MTIRPAHAAELRFIRETTLKVLWPRRETSWHRWERDAGPEVDTLLAVKPPLVLADGDLVVGFVVTAGAALYMLYVKRSLRGFGFGAALLERAELAGDPVAVWNVTDSWKAWARGRGMRWRCERGGKAAA